MRQEELLLKHLRTVGDISRLEADELYRVKDLPKRISVIKQENPDIFIESQRRKDATGQPYTRYVFHADGPPNSYA